MSNPAHTPTIFEVVENLIARTDDLIAAIEGTTDQFEPEVAALSASASAAQKIINKARSVT